MSGEREAPSKLWLQRALVLAVLPPFALLTWEAVAKYGYFGLIWLHLTDVGPGQVLADLVIALCFVMVWMWRDAKSQGRHPLGWIALTLAVGSFGPLLYLLTRRSRVW